MDRQLAIGALALLLRTAPSVLLQPALDLLAAIAGRRHRRLFQRVEAWAGASFLVAPAGMSRGLLLTLPSGTGKLRLRLVPLASRPVAVAVLRGPLPVLCDLLEGRIDGDAAFFGRRLRIEGDTGAVVALRNAIDDEEIDLPGDLLASLPAPMRRLALIADAVGQRR
jgi:O2-independent ubiquinone biosynthesis accessory factor UbiT